MKRCQQDFSLMCSSNCVLLLVTEIWLGLIMTLISAKKEEREDVSDDNRRPLILPWKLPKDL